ncbi:Uncharacterised protein [Serratia grimesii]|uniref:DUF2971 domain-containing protein n=1 Tax=Serratia grimesii TaxID=82995 RepID=UPI0021C500CB|nr:Uncharacterised protein [Serratia grimesii]
MNMLMWAYYSASMSGICVEFDEAKLIEVSDTETQIFDVVYSEESPVVDTAVLAVWDSVANSARVFLMVGIGQKGQSRFCVLTGEHLNSNC